MDGSKISVSAESRFVGGTKGRKRRLRLARADPPSGRRARPSRLQKALLTPRIPAYKAEGEGFEPSGDVTAANGFETEQKRPQSPMAA